MINILAINEEFRVSNDNHSYKVTIDCSFLIVLHGYLILILVAFVGTYFVLKDNCCYFLAVHR